MALATLGPALSGEGLPLYDRRSGQLIEEQIFERGQMNFFYGTPLGRLLEDLLLSRRPVSRLYGRLRERRAVARQQIDAFVSTYGIDLAELADPLESFGRFQDFFVRQLRPQARPLPAHAAALISPADARTLAIPLTGDKLPLIKGHRYSLFELLRNRSLARQFADGIALIYRLAPVDYHRFCYIDSGRHGPHVRLGSRLHSVNPLSQRTGLPVFADNVREYTLLHTRHFGPVLELDIGALLVGKIVQRKFGGGGFERGEEKGYFELGGSTILQLFEAGRVAIDADILVHSARNVETLLRCREAIGRPISNSSFKE